LGYIWQQLRLAVPLIWSHGSDVPSVTMITLRVALISTGSAIVIGLPMALTLGLGRFRGRRTLQILANASLALPPVMVGVVLLVMMVPGGALGGLKIGFTIQAVYLAQTVLALPYIVALGSAAIRDVQPGLLDQARLLGAGRLQLSVLAIREARIGLYAAVVAALASAVSEVAAVIIVGGNIQGQDQTLASAIVSEINDFNNIPEALALGIVLLGVILVLMAILTVLQRRGGVRLRWRAA
jgi:tungstate transport system permease protein